MSRHQSAKGMVMLSTWIRPELREYVRVRAREAGMPISDWLAKVIEEMREREGK